MKAIVIYESHWGNTAAVARAIAVGIGSGAQAMSTAEATPDVVAGADLIVAGAPLLGFSLPTEAMIKSLGGPGQHATPPDLSHPGMRAWLDQLPRGTARVASFETRIWWSPGSASKAILKKLEELGYQPAAKPERFIVQDRYGPLKAGELKRAQQWGATLARAG